MSENPLKILERLDPELLKLVESTSNLALSDGALPKKFKLLIAMALDASLGAVQGVKTLAQDALPRISPIGKCCVQSFSHLLHLMHSLARFSGVICSQYFRLISLSLPFARYSLYRDSIFGMFTP